MSHFLWQGAGEGEAKRSPWALLPGSARRLQGPPSCTRCCLSFPSRPRPVFKAPRRGLACGTSAFPDAGMDVIIEHKPHSLVPGPGPSRGSQAQEGTSAAACRPTPLLLGTILAPGVALRAGSSD